MVQLTDNIRPSTHGSGVPPGIAPVWKGLFYSTILDTTTTKTPFYPAEVNTLNISDVNVLDGRTRQDGQKRCAVCNDLTHIIVTTVTAGRRDVSYTLYIACFWKKSFLKKSFRKVLPLCRHLFFRSVSIINTKFFTRQDGFAHRVRSCRLIYSI